MPGIPGLREAPTGLAAVNRLVRKASRQAIRQGNQPKGGSSDWQASEHPRGPGGEFITSGSASQLAPSVAKKLGVKGKFTSKDVRAYQRKQDLSVDGKIGRQTASSLLGMKPRSVGALSPKLRSKLLGGKSKQPKALKAKKSKESAPAIPGLPIQEAQVKVGPYVRQGKLVNIGGYQYSIKSLLSAKPKPGLGVPEQHQLRIAKDTLKMEPAMAGVMGGPNHDEAARIITDLATPKPEKRDYETNPITPEEARRTQPIDPTLPGAGPGRKRPETSFPKAKPGIPGLPSGGGEGGTRAFKPAEDYKAGDVVSVSGFGLARVVRPEGDGKVRVEAMHVTPEGTKRKETVEPAGALEPYSGSTEGAGSLRGLTSPAKAKPGAPKMSGQDYRSIAGVLAQIDDPDLSNTFMNALEMTNPNFDRMRFQAAATGSPLSGRDRPDLRPGTPTARHFNFIAGVLKQLQDPDVASYSSAPRGQSLRDAAEKFADYFESRNPRFDRARFLKAAGV